VEEVVVEKASHCYLCDGTATRLHYVEYVEEVDASVRSQTGWRVTTANQKHATNCTTRAGYICTYIHTYRDMACEIVGELLYRIGNSWRSPSRMRSAWLGWSLSGGMLADGEFKDGGAN